MARRMNYEVNSFAQVCDPRGRRYFLGPGEQLPRWVSEEDIKSLVESGAVTGFEVI